MAEDWITIGAAAFKLKCSDTDLAKIARQVELDSVRTKQGQTLYPEKALLKAWKEAGKRAV